MKYRDRTQAGEYLAEAIIKRDIPQRGVVYALPRGGVPLAIPIADRLHMPLDLLIPRKLGHPANPEYAIGAVAECGERFTNQSECERLDPAWLDALTSKEHAESQRRRVTYLSKRQRPDASGKVAILVDDGIATGYTMRAAIQDARALKAGCIIVAIPVVPADTAALLREEVDQVIALQEPEHYLGAVGLYYQDFAQLTDQAVIEMLESFLNTSASD